MHPGEKYSMENNFKVTIKRGQQRKTAIMGGSGAWEILVFMYETELGRKATEDELHKVFVIKGKDTLEHIEYYQARVGETLITVSTR